MIDIHSHIIPNVDDGSISLNCTFSLVSAANRQGVTAMFATSHSAAFLQDPDSVYEAYYKMKVALEGWFPHMQFFLGCEICCHKNNIAMILEHLADGRLPSYNRTSYVLVEFSPWVSTEEALFCLSLLQQDGWIPIVAHPERYVHLDLDFIRSIRNKGCMVQLNISSLEEYAESHIRKRSRGLIWEELVDFLGSDCHNSFIRGVSIEQGSIWLQHNCSQEYLESITYQNASRLLINKEPIL